MHEGPAATRGTSRPDPGAARRGSWLSLLGVVLGASCTGGSEAPDRILSIARFELNECKRESETGQLATGRETSDYAGLSCVAWKRSSGQLAIDLINHLGGCGFGGDDDAESLWTPRLKASEGELALSIEWRFEAPSACGECLHDFSVTTTDDAIGSSLELSVTTRDCSECGWSRSSVTLLDDEEASGIRCQHIDSARLPGDPKHAGQLHGSPRNGACEDGLVARVVADDVVVCLATCTTRDDCPLDGLLDCEDGACQLATPL